MDSRTHNYDRGASGFSMIELVIATAFLMLLAFLVTNMVMSGNAAHKYADRLGRVTEITQQILDEMKRELSASVRLFGNDATGVAYKSRLETWSGVNRIASSTLPTVRPLERFGKDLAGTEKTGNELMFVRHAWADSFTCTSGSTYRVDVYRLVAYFVKPEGVGPQTDSPWGLNLCKWTSEPMVDASHIDNITDPADQADVLMHLLQGTADDNGDQHAPAAVVWLLGGDPGVAGTFRHIQPDGSLDVIPQSPRADPWEIERDDSRSSASMLFYRHHSLASNYAQANQGMSRFALRNDGASGIGFPHGLEIQIVGAPGARKIMIHMTTVSTNRKGMRAYYDGQVVMNMREG